MNLRLLAIFILAQSFASAQNDSIDIFMNRLKTASSLFEKAGLNQAISNAYLNKNIDSSSVYFNKAKELFPVSRIYQDPVSNTLKLKMIRLEADIFTKAGKLNEASRLYYDLLTKYANEINPSEKAYFFLQLGTINDYQGKSVAAVKYYSKANKIYDSINDKKGTSECLNNMAVVFYRQGEIDKGIEYLEQSLVIRRKVATTRSQIADLLENLGSMYLIKGDSLPAKKYYLEGLEYYKAENNTWGVAYALKNLAKYHIKLRNYDTSLEICNKILRQHTGVNDSSSISMMNSILSEIYFLKGDYKTSIRYGELAYSIAVNVDIAMRLMEASRALKEAYAADNNFKEAYKFLNIYLLMRDSINNNQTEKETLKQRLENEKEAERISHQKDLKIKEAEARLKNIILLTAGVGLLVILFFSGLLLKKFNETKKQKKVIEEQKRDVEEKQKEILDSINYAKRIQRALLPTEKYVDKSVKRLKK